MKSKGKIVTSANTGKNSRRNFVKNTALFTGGTMLLPNLKMNAMYNVFNDKKLKIALVGCGGRGTGAAIQALNADDNVQLVAMADAFEDRLKSSLMNISKEMGESKKVKVKEKNQFVGFDAAEKAMDLADVVILATPPGFRPAHFEYAINNGKHVFMEKPVATDVPGVRRVLAAAKKAKEDKLNVVVGLQRHYQDNYLAAIDQLKQDKIGKIVSGQVYWNSGGVWVRERKPEQSELEYQMRNWYYFNWLCGDHILEQHIHNIDVANWFIGEYPISAQGMGGRQVRTGKDHGEIFDHHFVEFTYPSGAVIASQCRHQPETMSRVSEFFQGTKGTVSTEGDNTTMKDWSGETLFEHRGKDDPNPYEVEHIKLFESIRNGGVLADAENGAKSTMTAIMGRMATYSGKVIQWEEAMQSELKLVPDALTWDSPAPVQPNADGWYEIPTPGKTNVM
ncbi:Gfo/Idh/MocA family oxidoreductase [Flavobacteriaceae bacterium TP-CH-4]|uniref:Gfo/Idh/MocA family oxidoreductase n=1 Tax=Pelagihabitans pacificus TaxID=2696054 RepID=A0A967ASE3_9FLAO|nr:Gfo/Idh/MocA family oxidoreductase [Pelagihabitans pacificus]NHF59511.1 Gfo/Idh/MocA family oxidoreductase [Pelagihabitans pacificus]